MHSNTHENIIDKYHCIWSTPNVFWNFQLHVPAVNAEHPIPRALAWNLNSKWCREVALFDRNLRKNLCFAVFECMRNLRENDFIQFSWNFIRITEPFECVRIARVRRWSSLVELICFFLVVYDIRVRVAAVPASLRLSSCSISIPSIHYYFIFHISFITTNDHIYLTMFDTTTTIINDNKQQNHMVSQFVFSVDRLQLQDNYCNIFVNK